MCKFNWKVAYIEINQNLCIISLKSLHKVTVIFKNNNTKMYHNFETSMLTIEDKHAY